MPLTSTIGRVYQVNEKDVAVAGTYVISTLILKCIAYTILSNGAIHTFIIMRDDSTSTK